MNYVFAKLDNTPIAQNKKHYWQSLHGSAKALAIAEHACKSKNLSLVVCESMQMASQLERELAFFAPELNILQLPDWETLPYDNMSPHQDIISERLSTLSQLAVVKFGVLVVPITTLMHRLAPRSFISANSLIIKHGSQFDIKARRAEFESCGYRCVDTVYEHGEFAVRGSIVDVFPSGARKPYRIDLFDEEVETLRTFDTETQLTIDKIDEIRLLPAREYPLDPEGVSSFRNNWHHHFDVDHRLCSVYQDVSDALPSAGIEYYLPLFFKKMETLFDYLPENTEIINIGQTNLTLERFWRELNNRFDSRKGDLQRPILPPQDIFLSADEVFAQYKKYAQIQLRDDLPDKQLSTDFNSTPPKPLPVDAKSDQPLATLQQFINGITQQSGRILLCAESAGRREVLLDLLAQAKLKPNTAHNWQDFLMSQAPLCITVAPLDNGLVLGSDTPLAVVTETQLFGARVQQRRRRKNKADTSALVIKHLTELKVGDAVVHIDHGVGRYIGLEIISAGGEDAEFLQLQYADEANLYVPVTSLHLISRYGGGDSSMAPLHRLGSEQWTKAKRRAAEKVRDTAAELLDIYAQRAARTGHAFADPAADYDVFSAGFPFEETPDQYQAIEDVRLDMLSPRAMDRLVCGDVGFGKTEVAMRAAFIAAHGGKQVALLAPTTLLAQQHYQSLRDRFADWPVNIAVMSRFKSNKENTAAMARIASGEIDIVVGTHKLLQASIKYKNLGLLIVDEEHRFGVGQKEKLKSFRANVDILAMTATPIPRTLNMSMAGIRDLSIIATPPPRRLSIKTFVQERDDNTIVEAISREILRGGQVYVLHNEVKSIERSARELQELLPDARIAVGHGQMHERELEQVMSDFYHKRFNVLVCTTIIETGIDIPSANTIIIERADKFGLAQLHQLRGRVGRSHHQAYAYLMTPHKRSMSVDAVKRLDAIAGAQELGAGFTLATHDMEIRGAGELLGDEQSGQIQTVGFTLYMDMLDRAVKSIKEGKDIDLDKPLAADIEINLRIPALMPDDYVPDVNSRLVFYKRLASCNDAAELKELNIEMIDRFGLLPDASKNLISVTELKFSARKLGITKLEASGSGGRIEFCSEPNINPMTIIQLIQTQPGTYQMDGGSRLKFNIPTDTAEQRLTAVADLLQLLAA